MSTLNGLDAVERQLERMRKNPFYGSRYNCNLDIPQGSHEWRVSVRGEQKGEVISGSQHWYNSWMTVVRRADDENRPMYHGWRTASIFKAWYDDAYWEGGIMRTDILDQHNRTYCPDYVVYVPRGLSDMLRARAAGANPSLPRGVYFCKSKKKYRVVMTLMGQRKSGGYHPTVALAEAKCKQLRLEVALKYLDELESHQHWDKFGHAVYALKQRLLSGEQTI